MTFKELNLKKEVEQAVVDLGFETPSPIQEQAIPVLLESDSDLVGLAQTGTGKTAAFGLPLISLIDTNSKHVQGLIISPTRELAIQIAKDLEAFSKYLKNFRVTPIYGGASIENQIREIKKGTHVIVATPGRLVDLIKRKKVSLAQVNYLILDEADEMLNMGFKEDIDTIIEQTPEHKRTWLFSATMPKDVARIAKNYMHNPKEVTVGSKNQTAANIEHFYFVVNQRNRYEALRRLLDYYPEIYGLIFCQTKRDTQQVADKLMADGYNTGAIHGDLSQAQRDDVMKKFRDKTIQILVATDVAARGIDVQGITHVINYKVPDDVENYTHRSGRTARAGKHGFSFSLTTPSEVYRIKQIERVSGTSFQLHTVPTGEDICARQLSHLVTEIKTTKPESKFLKKYMGDIEEELSTLSKEELIKRFLSLQAERFIQSYSSGRDINIGPDELKRAGKRGKADADRKGSRGNEDFARIFVAIGDRDVDNKGAILRFVCDGSGVPGSKIGKIAIRESFSFVDVDRNEVKAVVAALNGSNFEGRSIRVEEEAGGAGGGGGRGKGKRKGGKPGGRKNFQKGKRRRNN